MAIEIGMKVKATYQNTKYDEASLNDTSYKEKIINKTLLNINLQSFEGKWPTWNDQTISAEHLLNTAIRCKEYLSQVPPEHKVYRNSADEQTLSARQISRAIDANCLIGQRDFIHAYHEFMDCIDNYNEALYKTPREITTTEYAIYICFLEAFISSIKDFMDNNRKEAKL